jgi:SAM-dependent methyltransferase
MANEVEARRWNDPGWTTAWQNRERLTDAVSPHLLRAIDARPGQRICDIGCGGGTLTLALAQAIAPGGDVVGCDISAPLVGVAGERAQRAGLANVRFVQMDVQTDALQDGPFDQVVSQMGVMFFDEPTVAFRAIRGLLDPGGRLVFACWRDVEHNPWHVRTALRALLTPPPTPGPGKSPVGPFVFGDDEYVRDLLAGAGFEDVRGTAYDVILRAPANAVADPSQLGVLGVPAEHEAEAAELMERHLGRFAVGPDEYEYPLAFMVYEAANP